MAAEIDRRLNLSTDYADLRRFLKAEITKETIESSFPNSCLGTPVRETLFRFMAGASVGARWFGAIHYWVRSDVCQG